MKAIGDFRIWVILIACLSLAEVMLILLGVIQPVLSYSPPNLVFAVGRFAIIVYGGISFGKGSPKKAALKGAILTLAGVSVICLASLASKFYLGRPVLGLQLLSEYFLLVLLFVIAENVLLGAFIALCAAWIANRLKRR